MAQAQYRGPDDPLVRPRDAATLLLYRSDGRSIEVLMGERHGGHRFMPNRYVFPGGRVDRTDARVRAARELRPEVAPRVTRGTSNPARSRALALAAIRETFEETGLILGAHDPRPDQRVPEAWRTFFATGLAPDLSILDYLARAITPPYRPVRFNARFFMADAGHARGNLKGSGELLNLHWVPVAEARKLPIPNITEIVLGLLQDAVLHPPPPDPGRPVPLFRMRRGQHRSESE